MGDYRAGEPLREWVLALKHGDKKALAEPLGHALGERFLSQEEARRGASVLVPVPMPWQRRMERGYDQALLLARAVGERTEVPVHRLLRRNRWTPPQGTAGARSRSANVRGAFALRRCHRARYPGVWLWLVDDVVTSGATVGACCRELRQLRPAGVGVLCLARASESPSK